MENSGKTRIQIPGRSEGDGMENTSSFTENVNNGWGNNHQMPFTGLHNTHFVPSPGKLKGPKFVPYEPYKAAVSPILPVSTKQDKCINSKFVIDSQKVSSLASSIIKLYSNLENKDCSSCTISTSENKNCSSDCSAKIKILEEKVKTLEKENKELISQHQVQIEVNADLKKMLVASLGEDVQCKVQYMTEDKAHLGKEVLTLSEELEQAKEEIEKLTANCNVWESKFKASSLMVKELAHWKASLSHKLDDSITALNAVLKEHDLLFEKLYSTHSLLEQTLNAFDPSAKQVPRIQHATLNTLQLAMEIKSLTCSIQERLLGKLYCDKKTQSVFRGVRQFTKAENLVNQLFSSFNIKSPISDAALIKESTYDSGVIACKILPHTCANDSSVAFCKQCSGEIKTV